MKTKNIKSGVNLLLIFGSIIMISCSRKKDAVNIANDHNAAKFNDKEKINDSHFFVDAAEVLLQEMQLAKMAQNNSIRKDIIKIGEVTEVEYNQSYYSLKAIAEKKSVTIPLEVNNYEKNIYHKLSYEIADDFDKKYFNMAEKDHNATIKLFEKIQNESNDEDIKIWAVNWLPSVKKNLDSILILNKKYQKQTI